MTDNQQPQGETSASGWALRPLRDLVKIAYRDESGMSQAEMDALAEKHHPGLPHNEAVCSFDEWVESLPEAERGQIERQAQPERQA